MNKQTNLEDIREALTYLDPDMCYQDWLSVGMAINHETKGSEEGYKLWDEWSERSYKYDEDGVVTLIKWDGFDSSFEGGVTINTLFKMARDNGYEGNKVEEKKEVIVSNIDPTKLPYIALPNRKISVEVCKLYNVRTSVKEEDGKTLDRSYFPYKKDGLTTGWHVRNHQPKDKRGKIKPDIGVGSGNLDFFGQDVAKKNNGKKLFITEGRIDCISLYETITECTPGKWRHLKPSIVSINNGANSALKDCLNNRDFLNGFEEVILVFDPDEDGDKAVKKVLKSFPKFKVTKLPNGCDPNEMRKQGRDKELFDLVMWKAENVRQGEVVRIDEGFIEKALEKPKFGISTPWPSVDKAIFGIRPNTIHVVGAAPKIGKALALDTKIPTPYGMKTMGVLKIGDLVYNEQGVPTRVTWVSEVMINRRCFKITFLTGETVICDAQHLWTVDIQGNRGTKTVTTEEISKRVKSGGKYKYRIPVCKPVLNSDKALPIKPYTLGAWLGDGSSHKASITTADKEIIERINIDGYRTKKWSSKYEYGINYGFRGLLTANNLIRNKHIPEEYFFASVQQRRELLQGLLDTDGTACKKRNNCEFTSTNKNLAIGVHRLLSSLGIRATINKGTATLYGKDCGLKYRVFFKPRKDDNVFCLERKNNLLGTPNKTYHRSIISCKEVENVPVKCISVDCDSHLYLCTESYIATHNSEHKNQLIQHLAFHHNRPVGVYDLEVHPIKTAKQIVSKNAGVNFLRPDVKFNKDLLKKELQALSETGIMFYDRGASREWEDIRVAIEEQYILDGVKEFFIDPLTALISRYSASEANDRLNEIMTDAADLVFKYPITLFFYSHVNPKPKTAKPHEKGGRVLSSEFTGSRALEKWSHLGMGISRDRSEDCAPEDMNFSDLHMLYDREFGRSMNVRLYYDEETTRYLEV